jgi:hypothetical protein
MEFRLFMPPEFPRRPLLETVWKIKIVRIVESHERAERDQQALFGHLTLPETTFNEPSSYFPNSLSRQLVNKRQPTPPSYEKPPR